MIAVVCNLAYTLAKCSYCLLFVAVVVVVVVVLCCLFVVVVWKVNNCFETAVVVFDGQEDQSRTGLA